MQPQILARISTRRIGTEELSVAMAGRGSGGQAAAHTEERIIPASRRPDGTLRKEIRIRAGYIPQDEVEKYVARGTRVSHGRSFRGPLALS